MSGHQPGTPAECPDGLAVRLLPEAFVKHTGGVRRASYDLLGALRAQCVNVEVAPWVDAHPFRFGTPAPPRSRRAALQAQAISDQLRPSRRTPITHSLYYDPAALTTPGLLVATAYDMIHERFDYGSSALRHAKRNVLGRADVVIAISSATAADVRQYLPRVREVVPIHLGIPSSFLSTAPATGAGRDALLYVGYRLRHKNFGLVLDAYRCSPALRALPLVLVGGPELTPSERDEITAATGRPAEQHRGVDDDALRDFYDRALVTVIPSRWEGFGLPVLEAMARRCPVACSNTASLAETAGGHARLFDAGSAEECADAILAAAATDDSALDSARAYAVTFTWEAAARAHAELYAQLI